ncbi:MAG TPA: lipopolysaccharide biosynthesis protein [Sphingomicrobium sp.]|nr:lipopolysaccharide biosynthesis protein [Sphingomicrobium sp.]
MRHWFRDRHFRSLLKNSSYLAVSKAVSAVAGLAAIAFAGRGLGLVLFGLLVLIRSYAQAASGLTKFQSWQLIVRYGGDALGGGDQSRFKRAIGFGLGLDIVSGLAGMAVAIALLPLIGHWFGIPDDYLILAMLYCLALPVMGAATPVGVLRSLDRFDLIGWQGSSYPIVRAVLAGIAWAQGASFETFLLIWLATDVGGELFLWFLAWRELGRREMRRGIRPTLRPDGLAGAWRFAIHVNLTVSLQTAWGPIARLVVGGLVGPAAAGLYRIAASLADSAQKPADLIARAYYPEVVRMDFATKAPWKLMLRGTALAAMVGIVAIAVVLLAGEALLDLLFGAEFLGAYPVLVVLMAVPLLAMLSFPLPPMLYALDRPDGPLKARLVGTLAYFAIVAPLAWNFGVTGAAAAYVAGYALMVLVLVLQLRSEHRRVRPPRAPAPGER